jgi:hypothetical protein
LYWCMCAASLFDVCDSLLPSLVIYFPSFGLFFFGAFDWRLLSLGFEQGFVAALLIFLSQLLVPDARDAVLFVVILGDGALSSQLCELH